VLSALVLFAALTAPAASASAAADLATSIASPATTVTGSYLSYTITATNQGPDTAASVVISDHTPANMWAAHPSTFYCVGSGTTWCGTLADGVSCTAPRVGSPGLVSCTTASVAAGASMVITIVIHVGFYLHNQIVSNTANASSSTFDPNPANNTATAWARVI
jgi:uncharacterized repeat protein (TIGR01451 family)